MCVYEEDSECLVHCYSSIAVLFDAIMSTVYSTIENNAENN